MYTSPSSSQSITAITITTSPGLSHRQSLLTSLASLTSLIPDCRSPGQVILSKSRYEYHEAALIQNKGKGGSTWNGRRLREKYTVAPWTDGCMVRARRS
ncbi:hypothetical protein E2C01_101492 [Portunus trituberculatus]|uniref:Uncharacterized protein n=1 Tax=Portunus trituberculatus TaxID=210409 RepID=A0A5B7K9R3_PORTR|nr:hypothetical protein [Portunus trituberculatus]